MGVSSRRRRPIHIPRLDLFPWVSTKLKEAIGKRLGPEMRARYKRYIDVTRLGVFAIIGFGGSGKTEILALTALLFLGHRGINAVYCCAPTDVAAATFAERLHRIAGEVGTEVGNLPLLVVRGYNLDSEVWSFVELATVGGPVEGNDYDASIPRASELSACEWLLKVVKVGDFDLGTGPPSKLLQMRWNIFTPANQEYGGLRLWLAGNISFSEIEDKTPSEKLEGSANLVRSLLARIVESADAVCTTPYTAAEHPFDKANASADAVILDDAHAMLQADALLAWGAGCRPCAMAGDPEQMPPTVMTNGEKRNGRCANMFSQFARVSVLDQLRYTGWLCFPLDTQFRGVSGQFDLAREVMYPHLPEFRYVNEATVRKHAQFLRLDGWVRAMYGAPRSTTRKILPLFFDCVGSRCVADGEGRSWHNPRQTAFAVSLVEGLLCSGLGPEGPDIVVLTPFRANAEELLKALEAHPTLAGRGVLVTTPEAFQGREARIVIFVLCVTEATGPLAAAEAHRLCVAVTRHVGVFFVVGDILTLRGVGPDSCAERVVFESGEIVSVTRGAFRRFIEYFRRTGRIMRAVRPRDSDGGGLGASKGRGRGAGGAGRGVAPYGRGGVSGRRTFWAGSWRGVGEKGSNSF